MRLRGLAAAAAAALLTTPPAAVAQGDDDRAAIVAVAQGLFDAMAARSAEQAMALVLPDGQLVAVRDDQGAGAPRPRSLREFASGLATQKSALLERMWEPDVTVHGTIATLSTRYDFHLDGAFSHCGTDVFSMVRTPDGWKIAGLIYTVERTGCAPSPLGPPKR